jgi:hypothetical protein
VSKNPPTLEQAITRGLTVDEKHGIYTFSNGTDWECWASGNCFACWHWDEDCAGRRCAFEGAALLSMVSPELARMFGWTRNEAGAAEWCKERNEPDDLRQWWDEPNQCAFFRSRTDDHGGDNPPPPEPDPLQLVLLADPTEDIGQVVTCDPAFYPELVGCE